MTHPGKEALKDLRRRYSAAPRRDYVFAVNRGELCDILAYVETLKVKAGAWDDHMEAEGAVLRDVLEHPERHRLIGPSEIRNKALEEAAKVADDIMQGYHEQACASVAISGQEESLAAKRGACLIATAIRALKQ